MQETIENIRESFSLPRKTPKPDRESINIRDDDDEIVEDVSTVHDTKTFLFLSVEALGVVYGDIGTSPLYTLSSILLSLRSPTDEDVIGATSLVIWSILIMVTLKYGSFILTADYRNEGGIFALCSLLLSKSSTLSSRAKMAASITCIIGASLLLGDGAITPAISVLSAISGIAVVNANLDNWVVPITIIVLILLFIVQPFGTSKIGKSFGPVVLMWMGSIFGIGIYNISAYPYVL
jgi:KUP system potassium uptake protein